MARGSQDGTLPWAGACSRLEKSSRVHNGCKEHIREVASTVPL